MTSGYATAKLRTSKGVILLLACAAQFMVVLDVAIVNVALPSIQRDLGVAVAGVRRLLVAGFTLLAISALLLTRVPAGGHFATDVLPALLLAGVAGGLSAPAVQIGALPGVTRSMTGLASGLVETMREIAGAIGVAAVWTVLVSRAGPFAGGGGRAARALDR